MTKGTIHRRSFVAALAGGAAAGPVTAGASQDLANASFHRSSSFQNRQTFFFDSLDELKEFALSNSDINEGATAQVGGDTYRSTRSATGKSVVPGWRLDGLPLYKRGVYFARDPGFGIAGDGDGKGGGTDDTDAITRAVNGLEIGETLIFTKDLSNGRRHYNVRSLKVDEPSAIYCTVRFESGVSVFGVADRQERGIIDLRGSQKQTWENLTVETDGLSDSPRYHQNYECAVRMAPHFKGEDGYTRDRAFQFNTFVGGQIRNIKRGIIVGNPSGEEPTASIPISENIVERFGFRGVEGCITMNALNAYIEFSQCMIIAQQFGASKFWWRDEDGFLIKAQTGSVTVTGGELQRAIKDGWALHGKEIFINGAICEWAAKSFVSGRMEVVSTSNNYYGPRIQPMFKIANKARGRLLVNGQWEKNNREKGGLSGVFVDASRAPDYHLSLDLDLVDFRWDRSNYLVVGGRQDIRRIALRDDRQGRGELDLTYLPRATSWDWRVATPNGDSMEEKMTSQPKGGWSQVFGDKEKLRFGRLTSKLPKGAGSAIRFLQEGGPVMLATSDGKNGIPLRGDETVLSFSLKDLSGSRFFGIKRNLFDVNGTILGKDAEIFSLDDKLSKTYGFNNWQNIAVPVNIDPGSRYIQIIFRGGSKGQHCDIAISNLSLT